LRARLVVIGVVRDMRLWRFGGGCGRWGTEFLGPRAGRLGSYPKSKADDVYTEGGYGNRGMAMRPESECEPASRRSVEEKGQRAEQGSWPAQLRLLAKSRAINSALVTAWLDPQMRHLAKAAV